MKPVPIAGAKPAGEEVILKDGQSLYVRPIRPDDKERLKDLFYRVSPETRYLRFHYVKNYISDKELRYFTEVRPPDRAAFVATTGEGGAERTVAVARWDRLRDDRKTAEVAFLVEDTIQVRGVGTALLEQLVGAAAKYKVKRFTGAVLPENTRMLHLFEESGFKTTKSLEEGVICITLDIEEQEEYEERQAAREHLARSAGVRRLLYPHSVAVIGASRDPESVGGAVFRNLLGAAFHGAVFPVNPNAASVGGVLAYPSVLDVPSDIDLAVIVVPAARVLDVVDDCGKKNVRGLVIISAGFGEAGPEGIERERLLKQKVVSHGMRLIGPNCLGIVNSEPNVRLDATFSPVRPPMGNLALGSQSGALGLALLDYANSINLGISHFVSIGNSVDISSNDLLEFWEDDENVDVILLYLESFGHPRKFSRIVRRLSRKKPIVAVKAGKSQVGARAASSHTGALAAADVAVDALFREAGVIRVDTIDGMFDVAQALAYQPIPKGPNVGIITNAGGPGVLAADACVGMGLNVPTLSKQTQDKLREFLPREAALGNPVDMIASAEPQAYEKALSIMLRDRDLDAILLIYIPPLVTRPEDVAASIRRAMSGYRGKKPVLANFMMSAGSRVDLRIDDKRYVPSYIFPESAVRALARAYHYSVHRRRPEGRIPKFPEVDAEKARRALEDSTKLTREGTWLLPEVAEDLLKEYGIPMIDTRIAASAEEAVEQALTLDVPIAMKVRSSSVVHKTELGAIALGLMTEKEIKLAFHDIMRRLKAAGLREQAQGVVLQPMVEGAQEVIVGMSQDPVFGPLVMAGMGGTEVELLKDVAFSLHPVTDVDADQMLRQLKSFPLLEGWRNNPVRDVDALKEVLLRFSALIEDFPEIDQMEINPLMVFEKGHGCVAVDVRVFVKAVPET